jgi:N-acetyl-anhydromuramyl-L-alanine amidase AmpD
MSERKPTRRRRLIVALTAFAATAATTLGALGTAAGTASAAASQPQSLSAAFSSAAHQFGVPAALLEAECYMEGRLSDHGGTPSVDQGYGCEHLVHNDQFDNLDQAAALLHEPAATLRTNLPQNVRGAAAVLRADALMLSPTHTLPTSLGGWYAAVAYYSDSRSPSVQRMYADALYQQLATGFSARADDGELITLAPTAATPDRAALRYLPQVRSATLPSGCGSSRTGIGYPAAVNCIVGPASKYDCNVTPANMPCTYQSANRPTDFRIDNVVIHDTEGSLTDTLNTFQNPNSGVSITYVVNTDGTVYQLLQEKDIAYQVGNFYYNEHTIGIEHIGFDATGYEWYNTAQYLGSAKLVAYLLKKYHLPLDRAHVVAHGTVPSPNYTLEPNHVDPGGYWLWDYYFSLIHRQGVPYPRGEQPAGAFQLEPTTDQRPAGPHGTETSAQYNFFSLYTGPSTADPLIPNASNGKDITDETYNIEPDMPYYAMTHVPDPANPALTMYEMWYGENDQLTANPVSHFEDAKAVWLAVPSKDVKPAIAKVVEINSTAPQVFVYGRPQASSSYILGFAPSGSEWASTMTLDQDGTTTLFYCIDFDHRQAWVPASEVKFIS